MTGIGARRMDVRCCSKRMLLKTCLLLLTAGMLAPLAMAQNETNSGVVLFWEEGFPSVDVSPIPLSRVHNLFPGVTFAGTDGLDEHLDSAKVLILPYGSAFAETSWPAILRFLQRGGNLVVLGGRPFLSPAFKDTTGKWLLRPETQAFARELRIYDFQLTSGDGAIFRANNDVAGPVIPEFRWGDAWSLVVRLSESSMDEREGSAGSLDATLNSLAWGERNGDKLSVPAIEIDHLQHAFVGSRWELLTCDPGPDFWSSPVAGQVVRVLMERAREGASELRLQPQFAVFAPGEPWRFELHWARPGAGPQPLRIELAMEGEGTKPRTETLQFTPTQLPFEIGFEIKPSPKVVGLQHVTAKLFESGRLSAVYETGFWMRDDALLRSGPVLGKTTDYLALDGNPRLTVGTTYMASDVQRRFFEYPNPYVWDRDMDQIAGAGLNMLRTGWWTGWDRLTENGVASEKTLRALEAYLLTARKHELPVQFTFFAFMPDVLGGINPYLDPAAIKAQQTLIRSVIERFRDVPYLSWDIINEPSFTNPKRTWMTRPNGDEFELRAWNEWLMRRYKSHVEIASRWHSIPVPDKGLVPLPSDADFSGRGLMAGSSPARAFDYHLFAQESFATWAAKMRETIRGSGSRQLVTVGQDEGGVTDRPLTAYFAPAVDFTTNHTWWLNDALLWDSLAAKQPGQPLLIQETGIQHESNLDGSPRMTEVQEGRLFERKLATALGTSAGAIQWLWNTNSYMLPEMELTIGAVHPDGTRKAEADVLHKYAAFARETSGMLSEPVATDIVIVQSQALQLSPYGEMALGAQKRAVRTLHYDLHLAASVLAENQLDKIGSPKLVILPSPQSLTQPAWERLLSYVQSGGHLLVTGPVERDEHWFPVKRISALSKSAKSEPLLAHYSELQFGTERLPLTFNAEAQQRLERLTLPQFVVDLPAGSGHIYVTADPVELAENPEATARLYRQIAQALDLKPAFETKSQTGPVLIRATDMKDAVLYLFVSESEHGEPIDITDRATGTHLTFTLPPQRARLALIRKSDHKVIWSAE